MNKYGRIAIESIKFCKNNTVYRIVDSWQIIADKEFGKGTSSANKGCPKNTL